MCPVHRHTSGSEMSKVRLLESQLQGTVKCGELFCFHAACWRCVFMLCTLGVLCTHPLFLMLFRKGQNQLKSFTPHRREKLPERTNLSCSPGGKVCILQCRQLQVYRRYIPIQQNMKTPPGLRTPLSSHDISSPEVGQPSKCLLCFAYPCNVLKAFPKVRLYSSGVFCLGQYFQQLIIRKEVEPENKG